MNNGRTTTTSAINGRLTLYLPNLPAAEQGGVQVNTIRLSQGFVEAGWGVDIVVTGSRKEPLADVPTGVRIVNLNVSRGIMAIRPFAGYLRKTRPEAVIAARPLPNCVAIWARALSKTEPKIVLSEHSAISADATHAHDIGTRVMPRIMAWTYPKANAIVAVSSGVADDLSKTIGIPRKHIHTIYNPIYTDEITKRSRESISHPWLTSGKQPVILGVGRLAAEKDFGTLIRAFAQLRQNRHAKLIILGEGAERHTLEALAVKLGVESDVAMPGFVDNPYPYMKAASVFVLSSLWEGFGNVLVEAMACGLPVVSTNCPSGPAEILEKGRWGQLVPVCDHTAMSNAILKAMTEDRERAKSRAQFFTVRRAVESYHQLLGFHTIR